MSKHSLIASIATKTGETQAAVGRVLDALGEEATDLLRNGEEVPLVGIGKLKAMTRKGRMGRNPSTGAAVEIAAKVVPKFLPSKALKDALN